MKSNKINYFVVGGFVLIMLAGLVVSVAVLTGRTGATDSYYAVYNNVTGIKFGSQVLYEGYPVGQIEDITPHPRAGGMSFRVDFSVKKDWRIPEDSIAQIAAPGLLSAVTISISAGKSTASLEPGGLVNSKEAANIFAVVSSVAADVNELAENNLKPLLNTINTAIGGFGELLQGDAQQLIIELTTLIQNVAERAPKISENIEAFSNKINQSSDELSALFKPENRQKLEAILGNLDILLVTVNGMVDENKRDINESIVDMRRVTESVARHIDQVNQNLEGASRNMYEFSRQIRQNPGLLLGGTPPKDKAVAR
ncbi:MAG: MlaD family protein [Rhodospirillales bacterium]